MTATTIDPALAGRLAEAEARIARLEAKLHGAAELDDALDSAAAARFVGCSVRNLYRICKSDPALAKCYHRALPRKAGASTKLVFSRKALERWKAARS
jgi:hypothetical protein